ncbi:MAG: transposase [Candidatus Omnitrophica bacterium]|nr:transposase [Candidatus Omnitrophota bacterium]
MARPYRLQASDTFYHITSRGDDRKKIFRTGEDYNKFLTYLGKAKERFAFRLYAYVLMSNHYHLLIETLEPNLSRLMQYINSAYTTYHNLKYKRSGHVFQGRYKSIIVDKDNYFLELSRYIHLNPVRAKIVEHPEKYQWSSYLVYLKKGTCEYIDVSEVNRIIGMGAKEYEQFVFKGKGIKESLIQKPYAGFILGSTHFIKDTIDQLKQQVENKEVSYKSELMGNVDPQQIIEELERLYKKSWKEIITSKKRPMKEKQLGIYIMRRLTGMNNKDIGKYFEMKEHAVSKVTGAVESKMEKDKNLRNEIEVIVSSFNRLTEN